MATRHTYSGTQQHYNGSKEQQGQAAGVMGQARAAGEAIQSQAQHVVEDYPISTVLAVFGIGLGVGVILGSALLSQSSSSSWSSSSWYPSGSSSWFPSMGSSSSSWFPTSGSGSSWFGGNGSSNWTDSMMRSAKSMCGY